jgi:uncharacterized protein (DUF2249 family)
MAALAWASELNHRTLIHQSPVTDHYSQVTNQIMNTQTPSVIGADKVMDVRPIPCSTKHGLILKTWRELPVGDHFILLNDHDPVPLRYQFEAEFPGAFTWDYLERGPADFRVKLTKLQELPPPVASEKSYGCSGH